MGEPNPQQPPVKIFFAIMAADDAMFTSAETRIEERWGAVDLRDDAYDFDPLTDYYATEFGTGLRKRIVSVEPLARPEALVEIKLATNTIEHDLSDGDTSRSVNIDPGYLSHSKVVLASTKDHYHRVYVGYGIFEELTLTYRRKEGGWLPFEWTYADYRMPQRLEFMKRLRERYTDQLKEVAA